MKVDRKFLGGLAEAKVLSHLISEGYHIYLPFLDNGPVDMVASKNGKILRVSVKGTSALTSKKSWRITLSTTSRRKIGCVVNMFNKDTCDIIAAYILPLDKVILIDVSKLDVKREIAVDIEDTLRIYKE